MKKFVFPLFVVCLALGGCNYPTHSDGTPFNIGGGATVNPNDGTIGVNVNIKDQKNQCEACADYALKREKETFDTSIKEMKVVHQQNVKTIQKQRRNCSGIVVDTITVPAPVTLPTPIVPSTPSTLPEVDTTFTTAGVSLTAAEVALADEIGQVRTQDNIRNRAVFLGDNFPDTPAKLNYCVYDMEKSAVNHLNKLGFEKTEIRIITNKELTAAGIKKWIAWAYADTQPGDRRGVFMSMHGAEDTDAAGKIMQIIVTYDMVSTGSWTANTEVEPGWITSQLQGVCDGCNAMLVMDLCHAGGVRPIQRAARKAKSIEGPDYVVQRVTNATQNNKAFANINTLNCTFIPMCGAGQLSEESSTTGGAGTWAFWRAIDKLGPNARAVDIVKEMRIDLRANAFSQTPECLGKYALKAPYKTQ